MKAGFSRNNTKKVDEYMDSRIGDKSHMSFTNAQIDATITLDDHTTFYMKQSPGVIEINLIKRPIQMKVTRK